MEKGKFTSFRKNQLAPRDISESLGKLPPQALDLEEAVLGASMLEKDALMKIIDVITPEDFYKESHREIFQAIVRLYNADKPVDMRTVVHQLRSDGKLELLEGNGTFYVAELTSKVSSAANIEEHARIVAEVSMKRKLIEAASVIHHDAYEDGTDPFVLMDGVQAVLDGIAGKYIRKAAVKASQLYEEAVQRLIKARGKKGLVGVPSGYTALDRVTGGWRAPDLVIIAARPSMGKSAVAGNVVRNAAIDWQKPTALFSLEMSSAQFIDRMLSSECEIDLDLIIKGTMDDFQFTVFAEKTTKIHSAPIFIDDTSGISILELRAKCRRLKAEQGIELIVVDYLQLVRGDLGGNREQEIASVSRALKGIAKELNVPVLALSQLSRAVETRGGDKRPQLSDLRESGSIEQDADIVMFLYRPEYYKITVYEDGTSTQGILEVIIAKNRNGSCETVMLRFIGKFSKVMDWDQVTWGKPATSYIPGPPMQKSYKDYQVGRNQNDDDYDTTDGAPF